MEQIRPLTDFSSLVVILGGALHPERLQFSKELWKGRALGVLHLVNSSDAMKAACTEAQVLCAEWHPSFPFGYAFVAAVLQSIAGIQEECKHNLNPLVAPSWLRQLHTEVGCSRLVRATGVVWAHLDFWVLPKLVAGLRPDVPWRLHAGLLGKTAPTAITIIDDEVPVTSLPAGKGVHLGTLRRGAAIAINGSVGFEYNRHGGLPKMVLSGQHNSFRLANQSGWISRETVRNVTSSSSCQRARTRKPPFELQGFYVFGTRHVEPQQHCFSGDQLAAERRWLWNAEYKRYAAHAADGLANLTHQSGLPLHQLEHFAGVACAGWVDMYHVPMRLTKSFTALAEHYARLRIWDEISVATILHVLSHGSHALHEEVVDECFGCCCCNVGAGLDLAAVLHEFPCGHRIDL